MTNSKGKRNSRKKKKPKEKEEKVKKAQAAVEELCGKCPVCSPDCPVAIARRALAGLAYDLAAAGKES